MTQKTFSRYFGETPHRYTTKSGEQKLAMGKVRPLNVTNFADFTRTLLAHPVQLNLTQEEFHALPDDDRKLTKAVSFFCPATFNHEPGAKHTQKINPNCRSIALVCLDVDDPAEAGPILANLSFTSRSLGGLNHAIYKTASHTPESPRLRIVVDADDLDVTYYAQAVSHVARRVGLTSVTAESNKISQAMYRPVMFTDTDKIESHPLVAEKTDGVALQEIDIDMEADLMPKSNGAPGKKSDGLKPLHANNSDGLGGVEFLTPRSDIVTLDDVRDALTQTDPDLNMESWVKIAAGMRHQFYDNDDEAFGVFNDWSANGDKYPGEDSVRARWDSFAANPLDRTPTTIRTSLQICRQLGWSNEEIAARHVDQISEKIKEVSSSGGRKELKGILQEVSEMPLLDETDKALLLTELSTAYKAAGIPMSRTDLNKALSKLTAKAKAEKRKEEAEDKPAPSWTRSLVFIKETKKIFRTTNGELIDRDAFDSSYARELLPEEGAVDETGKPLSPRAMAMPTMRPQDYILNELKVPVVWSDRYAPDQPDEAIIKVGKLEYVNTYRRTHVRPSKSKTLIAEAERLIWQHASFMVLEEKYQRMLISFIAFMVQNPGKKIRWCVLCQGGEGTGKGLWNKYISIALGAQHNKVVDPKAVYSSFNDWMVGAQHVCLNEIHSKGKSRYELENSIKEFVADDTLSVNQKFRDQRQEPNTSNCTMFTNHRDALAISDGSRRFFVVASPLQTKLEVLNVTDTGIFQEIADFQRNSPGAIRAFFEQFEIPDYFEADGHAMVTKYQLDMQEATKPELRQVIEATIEDSEEFDTNPLIKQDIVSGKTLLEEVNRTLTHKTNDKAVSNTLIAMGYVRMGRKNIMAGKHTMWMLDRCLAMEMEVDVKEECDERIRLHETKMLED